jgi:pimeloyl-ACP methyl ester carboxylesterase
MRRVGHVSRLRMSAALCVASLCVLSCGVPPEPTLLDPALLKPSSAQEERGLVWMFPGLVGVPWELGPAYRGLRDAGLNKVVRFFQWDIPAPDFISHLTRYEDNAEQAKDVAAAIAKYRRRYPQQPIDLVGYSAGGFMALKVAEALPEDVRVRNVILAQPGTSPTYDLSAALWRIEGELVVFYTPSDTLLGGVFTTLFGTLDREFVESAGKNGFDLETAAPIEAQRARVTQVPWSEEWAKYGHPGDHMAILQYRWNKYIVAPYLVDPEDLRIESPADAGNAAAAE